MGQENAFDLDDNKKLGLLEMNNASNGTHAYYGQCH